MYILFALGFIANAKQRSRMVEYEPNGFEQIRKNAYCGSWYECVF